MKNGGICDICFYIFIQVHYELLEQNSKKNSFSYYKNHQILILYILFLLKMEISTSDLFQVKIQENKLQNNFIIIQKVLQSIQQRVSKVEKDLAQKIMVKMDENKCHLEQNKLHIANHTNKLITHSQKFQKIFKQIKAIQQVNADIDSYQMAEDPKNSQKQHIIKEKEIKLQNHQSIEEKSKLHQSIDNHVGNETLSKRLSRQDKKSVQKSKIQRILTDFKQRIMFLENKQEEHNKILSYIQGQGSKDKNVDYIKHPEMKIEKITKYVEKNNSNISKDSPSLQQADNKHIKLFDNYQRVAFQSIAYKQLTSQQKLLKIEGEIQNMKELFVQRMRLIEQHLKQNQHKTQNIQKNMDILQRSHELIKYDLQRTSTSFSKTRNQNTAGTNKSHDTSKLNDTRITERSFYEDKLIQIFHEMDNLKAEYLELAAKMEKQQFKDPLISKCNSHHSSKTQIGARIINSLHSSNESELLKKQLSNCRRDLKKLAMEFQQFAYGVNMGTNQIKTILIKPNETKQDWKSLSTKMYRLKMQLQSNVKQLEGKIATSNDMAVILNQLETGIQQCKILTRKKVEIVDFQKTIKRVETRLSNFILQVYEKQGMENQVDASMVRQPWFCLSCDNEFKNYTGKMSKNLPTQKLNGKKVNTEHHMVRRNDYSRLPSVLK